MSAASRALRRVGPTVWALLLATAVAAALSLSHRNTGYVRDEGIYFQASRSYAAWLERLTHEPATALHQKVRDRHFAPNHEHPALMKALGGLCARVLSSGPRASTSAGGTEGLPEGAAMRLPAQALAGLACGALFLAGWRRAGWSGGLLAAGGFIALPRVWFHAGLHAFDVPVAAVTLMVALAYRRALSSARWGLAAGVLLGVAVAVKHNALFLGPLLAVHHGCNLLIDRVRQGSAPAIGAVFPWPLVSMAVVAPLVAWALWPWLWADPVARIAEYIRFHRQHSWYNMEFLGLNYNQPPMPWGYPFVMTAATAPAVLLALGTIGGALGSSAELRAPVDARARGTFLRPRPASWPRRDTLLFVLLAGFPIVLIGLPSTPIFGGTKHWITAYPFVALLAVEGWARLWNGAHVATATTRRGLQAVVLAAVLLPGALAIWDAPSLGNAQYAALAGGPRGAASMGLNRGFWGHAALSVLPERPSPTRLHLHDLHELARRQYAREGRWPAALKPSARGRADAGLIFHELHMTADEVATWNRVGTTAPAAVLELDDVPITSYYARGGSRESDEQR